MRFSGVRQFYAITFQVACFASLGVAYFLWSSSDELGDFGGDNAVYLLTAEYLSPWRSHSAVAAYFAQHSLYPPMYSIVLAMFGGAESIFFAHVITTGILLVAFLVLFYWQRALGFAWPMAGVVTLLFALLPGTYFEALSIHSEGLYLLMALVALTFAAVGEKSGNLLWYGMSAVAVAGATLTRSAGISLLAAFTVYLLLRRPRRVEALILIAAGPMLIWNIINTGSGGYIASFLGKYGTDPLESFRVLFTAQAVMLWHSWMSSFTESPVGVPVMIVAGLISVAGAIHRLYVLKLDGIYSVAYLGLILVWPFPGEMQRLIFVILPVLLVQGLILLGHLPMLVIGRLSINPAQFTYLSALWLVVLPTLMLTVVRYFQPLPAELAGFRHTSGWYVSTPDVAMGNITYDSLIVNGLRNAKTMVPETDCIYSIKPSIISFYTGRISIAPPRESLSDAEFGESLRESNCRFFYLMGFSSPTFRQPYYPAERLADSLKILWVGRLPGTPSMPAGILAEFMGNPGTKH